MSFISKLFKIDKTETQLDLIPPSKIYFYIFMYIKKMILSIAILHNNFSSSGTNTVTQYQGKSVLSHFAFL